MTVVEGVQAFTVVEDPTENDFAVKVAGGLEPTIMKYTCVVCARPEPIMTIDFDVPQLTAPFVTLVIVGGSTPNAQLLRVRCWPQVLPELLTGELKGTHDVIPVVLLISSIVTTVCR